MAATDVSQFERMLSTLAVGVVRVVDGHIAFVNEEAARIFGEAPEALLGRDLLDFIEPTERAIVAERHMRRLRGDRAPSAYIVTHVRSDGTRLRVEVEPRVLGPNEAVTVMRDVTEHLPQTALVVALTELATKVHRGRTHDEVLELAGSGLLELGLPCAWLRVEGDHLVFERTHLSGRIQEGLEHAIGRPVMGLRFPLARSRAIAPVLRSRRSAYYEDMAPIVENLLESIERDRRARFFGDTHRALVAAIVVHERVWGALGVMSPSMTAEDAAALSLFAAQVSSTLQVLTSLADLERTNRDIAALHAVAQTAGDVSLEAQLPRLCQVTASATASDVACVMLVDDEHDELVLAAEYGLHGEIPDRYRRLPQAGSALEDVARDRALRVFGPAEIAAHEAAPFANAQGLRHAALLPLLLQDRVVGVLGLARRHDDAYLTEDLSAATILAAQLAIQVDNARLHAGAHRRLAMLEVLFSLGRVASEANEVAVLTERVVILLGEALTAESARLYLADGDRLRLASWRETGETSVTLEGLPLDDSSLVGRVALSRRAELLRERRATPPPGGTLLVRHELAAPLVAGDRLVGVLSLVRRTDRPFADDDLRLLESGAAQTALAIERARLFEAARDRVEELQLLVDVGRTMTSSLDLDAFLLPTAHALARLVGASTCHIFLLEADRRELWGAACSNPALDAEFSRLRISLDQPSVAAQTVVTRNTVMIPDVDAENSPIVSPTLRARYGSRSLLALPLMARDEPVGCVVVNDTRRPRIWTDAEVQRAMLLSNQLGIAVANARLYEDLRRSYADLARAQEQLVRRERLAALGELAAVVAHEVRNPVAVVFNALSALRKIMQPTGDAGMLLGIIGEEADRLNRIVGDLLDFARPSEPALAPEALSGVIRDTLDAAATEPMPKPVEIRTQIDASLPEVRVDARMLRQALLNVVVNGLQSMPRGGVLTVGAHAEHENGHAWARVDVADTGPGIPPEIAGKIFQPFFTTKATGTGLGLAVVKRIMEAHRGEVTVASRPGEGTTVSLRLPLDEAE